MPSAEEIKKLHDREAGKALADILDKQFTGDNS